MTALDRPREKQPAVFPGHIPPPAPRSHVLDFELTPQKRCPSADAHNAWSGAGSLTGIPDHAGAMPNVVAADTAPRVVFYAGKPV